MSAFLMVKGPSPTDYDSYKDVITRIGMKPYPLKKNLLLSTGVSLFEGGLFQNDKYLYTMDTKGGNNPAFVLDSSSENIGQKLPRQYYGADAQLKWIHKNRALLILGRNIGRVLKLQVMLVPKHQQRFRHY